MAIPKICSHLNPLSFFRIPCDNNTAAELCAYAVQCKFLRNGFSFKKTLILLFAYCYVISVFHRMVKSDQIEQKQQLYKSVQIMYLKSMQLLCFVNNFGKIYNELITKGEILWM